MSHETTSPETTFGYLSVIESSEYGYFGGYLIVSVLGRPLEFHCTAPVRPSRAQKILYGPTLQPYLLGEQIAGALLKVVRSTPAIILTNCDAVLEANAQTRVPLVLICGNNDQTFSGQRAANPLSETTPRSMTSCGTFRASEHDFTLAFGYEADQAYVIQLLTLLGEHVDVAEPFDRIGEAIREAQRIGERGTEAHDQAA